MNLKNISDQVSNLDTKQKSAILELIDLKTNQDMKEVISEIRLLKSDMDTKFSAIDIKFNAKFEALESKIGIMYWLIGVIGILIALAKFID